MAGLSVNRQELYTCGADFPAGTPKQIVARFENGFVSGHRFSDADKGSIKGLTAEVLPRPQRLKPVSKRATIRHA